MIKFERNKVIINDTIILIDDNGIQFPNEERNYMIELSNNIIVGTLNGGLYNKMIITKGFWKKLKLCYKYLLS